MDANYNRAKLQKDFFKLIRKNKIVLKKYFNENIVESIIENTFKNYTIIIPQIQWIGGKKNPLTNNLIGSAQLLALIIELESRKLNFNEIGGIIYDIYEKQLGTINTLMVFFIRKFMKSTIRLKKMLKASYESQKRKYKDDWIFEYKIINNKEKLFENTYFECAICKLYNKLGYSKYLPILCLLDYATFEMLGLRLERTMTIGNGCEKCDFKVFKHGNNNHGWPPENHSEYCGHKDGRRTTAST